MKLKMRKKRLIKIIWIVLSFLMVLSMVFFSFAPMF